MKTLAIRVKKQFPYKGKQHKVGSVTVVPEKFARVMIAINKAEEYREPKPKPEPPQPKIQPKAPPRRNSRTTTVPVNRAMQAEKQEDEQKSTVSTERNTYQTKAADDSE